MCMVNRTMFPNDICVLISRTYEYITFHGKRDFVDVVKQPEIGSLSWIIWVGPDA